MSKPAMHEESPTMQEVHRLQEEVERQYEKIGLTYLDWPQGTVQDLQKELADAGFRVVTKEGRTFLQQVAPPSKRSTRQVKLRLNVLCKNATQAPCLQTNAGKDACATRTPRSR